eukprot:Colp12_sorted_trinity150504_noHs@31875
MKRVEEIAKRPGRSSNSRQEDDGQQQSTEPVIMDTVRIRSTSRPDKLRSGSATSFSSLNLSFGSAHSGLLLGPSGEIIDEWNGQRRSSTGSEQSSISGTDLTTKDVQVEPLSNFSAETVKKATNAKKALEEHITNCVQMSPSERLRQRRKLATWTPEDAAEKLRKDVIAIWARDITSLPVAVDIPRLVRSMKLQDFEGTALGYGDTESGGVQELVKGFLRCLCKAVDATEKDAELLEEGLARHFDTAESDSARVAIQLRNLLADSEALRRDSRLVLVLKTCNQGVVAPMFGHLKIGLGSALTFRSVPRGWEIIIKIDPEGICVVHRMREIVHEASDVIGPADLPPGNSDAVCTFEWEGHFKFNPEVSEFTEVTFDVTQVGFNPALSVSGIRSIQRVFKKYGYAPVNMPFLMQGRKAYRGQSVSDAV